MTNRKAHKNLFLTIPCIGKLIVDANLQVFLDLFRLLVQ